MLKNPYYLYGSNDVSVPADLNFGEFILSKFWLYKNQIATINAETHEKMTYGELAEEAMCIAVSLVRMGVRKGDVVAVCSESRKEFWPAAIGVACAGAVMTPFNVGCTMDELKHILNLSKPKFIFCSPQAHRNHGKYLSTVRHIEKIIIFGDENLNNVLLYKNLAKGLLGDIEKKVDYENFRCVDVEGQNDTLFILYSSGTTGLPKGVMLTHLNILSISVQPVSVDAKSTMVFVTPWYHTMGLIGGITYLATGRPLIYLPRFHPELYLQTIERYQVSQISVVPSILITLTKFPSSHDLSSVRVIGSGAAPVLPDTINAFCAKFPNADTVHQSYGMTETNLICKSFVDDKPKAASVGKVVKGVIVKIVDIKTRKPLGKFQEGEICVKGVMVMKGYIGRDRKDDFDEEGFFQTGDIGYYDEEGYVFIAGRLKELIKYKGYQVAPAEIEAALLQHEGVQDAGVVGVADAAAGEVPLAFVVAQPGAALSERELQQFVAQNLSNPKHLRGGVRFVPEIPKNPSGKILRNRLREMAVSGRSKL